MSSPLKGTGKEGPFVNTLGLFKGKWSLFSLENDREGEGSREKGLLLDWKRALPRSMQGGERSCWGWWRVGTGAHLLFPWTPVIEPDNPHPSPVITRLPRAEQRPSSPDSGSLGRVGCGIGFGIATKIR